MNTRRWEKFTRRPVYKSRSKWQAILDKKVRTDLEEIWDVYQSEVLPDCRRYIEEKRAEPLRRRCSRSSTN